VSPSWRRYFRPQDLVWLLLFSTLVVTALLMVHYETSPSPQPFVPWLLVALWIVKVLEPYIGTILAILIELGLCFGIIFGSGQIASSFYLLPLLPVISAATNFGLRGTVFSTLAACAVNLSQLVFLKLEQARAIAEGGSYYVIERDQYPELVLKLLWFPLVGFLTYQLAKANREETRKLEATAKQLAEANQHLKEAEAEVRRSERLAALGQLTAGLAHELRNPLGTMKSSAELLSRQVAGENEIAKEMASYIATEVDRTNSLITRFLDFARPQHLRVEKGDIEELLDRVIQRFEREKSGAAASVSIYKNYSPDIPQVAFDGELLERALLNLVANAAQASAPGSVVTVKTRMVETSTGPGVEIAVIDRGSGIDPKHMESIFNPFFTTKSEGVGLGLAIVSKIIDEHGGQIAVESAPGEGSVFRVYLPAVRE
jgi:two-component system, NtrC family, sensor histidine kinase HydH